MTSAASGAKFVDAAQRAYGAHVLCVQETKQGSAGEIAVQRAWQSAGWHGIHGAARLTGVDAFSKSGGVAVLAKKFIGVGLGGPWESPVTEQARAVVGKVATAARHGWAIASVYLITGEGASPANLNILDGVHRRLTAIGGPRIIGGDFQMQPRELLDSGWPTSRGYVVVAGDRPTCVSTRTASTIDYFLVAAPCGELVRKIEVCDGFLAPHRLVRITLASARLANKVTLLRQPKPFPPRIVGPVRRTCGWDAVLTECDAASSLEQVQHAYGNWATLMDDELVEAAGLTGSEQDSAMRGRALGARTHRATHPDNRGVRHPRGSALAAALRALVNSVLDLRWILSLGRTPGRLSQARSLLVKIRRWRPPTARTHRPQPMGPAAVALFAAARRADFCFRGGLSIPVHLDGRVQEEVASLDKAFARTRDREWRAWVKKAISHGAGPAHAWSRQKPLEVREEQPLSLQLRVEREAAFWQSVWDSSWCEDLDPWPPYTGTPPSADEVREAARSFSWKKAIGPDGWQPRALADASDEAISATAVLLHRMEEFGPAVNVANLVSLPKPTGGYRVVGLIAGLSKLLQRVRRPMLRQWQDTRACPQHWGGVW